MPRGLTSAQNTALAGDHQIAYLVDMDFSTPIYMTNNHYDITYNGNVYDSEGGLIGIGPAKEEVTMSKGTMSIVLSGVDTSHISLALTESYIDKEVNVYLLIFDMYNALVGDPVPWWSGYISDRTISDDMTKGASEVAWSAASRISWGAVSGLKGNDFSHQQRYPGDNFFKLSYAATRDLKWGRT